MLGPPLALALNVPFFMLRKKGKMPNVVCGAAYSKVTGGGGVGGIVRNVHIYTKWMGLVYHYLYTFVTPPLPPTQTTPNPKTQQEYEGDEAHGGDTLCISKTAVAAGDRVLLVDDLIATGGTLLAGVELVKGQQVGGVFKGF